MRAVPRKLSEMRWGDLADVICDARRSAPVRVEAERLLRQRCAGLALGARVTLARRPSTAIVAILRDDPDPAVLSALAGNPRATAADLSKIVARNDAPPEFLAHLAASPWRERRDLLTSIVRHAQTPRAVALGLLRGMTLEEVSALAHDPGVPRLVRTACERRSRA
ncbi:MAG TPA: hypothetical protein VFV19_13395 [Candidatus Polarisedimenticolaceae bacterium]|nr:hypothetical protein [Candidatus Polarisedimenticolaceae bacterium]